MSRNGNTVALEAAEHADSRSALSRAAYAMYGLCIAASVAVWLPGVGAPLWMDETIKTWSIAKGFWQIPFRQDGLTFPAYSYILWLATRVLGTSEPAMRAVSLLAMLGAAWVFYLAAREIFERDVAAIAVVVFCLEPMVVFASLDIGVYAFATLMTAAAILLMLRLRRTDSNTAAVLLGLSTAGVIWFHYLFAVIAPALVTCLFVVKRGSGKALWRQLGAAACGFALGSLPVIPGLLNMFRTRATHVFEPAPEWGKVIMAVVPSLGAFGVLVLGLLAALMVAAADGGGRKLESGQWLDGLVCALLAVIPLGILFGVSALTPLHISGPPWHLLSAAPGIALCWAWLGRTLRLGWLRAGFCVLLAAAGVYSAVASPMSVKILPSDKVAVAVAEKDASADGAPVMVCSDFVESDYTTMPVDSAKESRLMAPLSYYRLSVPVVPLPKSLNAEAMRVGGSFVEEATAKHEPFLALGNEPSYPTLEWLTRRAAGAYSVRELGVFDYVKVLEFTPRGGAGSGGVEKR
jgi:hypothetical protein